MKYAIELYFDRETERQLARLSQRVAEENLSTKFLEWKSRPHLTLACYNDVDEAKCIGQLKRFAQSHRVFPAYLGSVGMFNDSKTIFALPIMTRAMYSLQAELYEFLEGYDTSGHQWYCPDRWVPHCTLALTGEDEENVFYRASDLILHEFRKASGEFVAIGLVQVTFPVKEIFTVKLGR